MNFGKTILDLRKQKNVTQDEMAAELGVTAAAVSKWENGYTLPDILMLCALADYFQVTTDALLGRNPKPLCAAVATDSLPLLDPIEQFLREHSFPVKHKIFGSYAEALEIVKNDPAVTHLFVSYDDPDLKYEDHGTDARVVGSHADTVEHILDGFELYINNMPHFEALALKK